MGFTCSVLSPKNVITPPNMSMTTSTWIITMFTKTIKKNDEYSIIHVIRKIPWMVHLLVSNLWPMYSYVGRTWLVTLSSNCWRIAVNSIEFHMPFKSSQLLFITFHIQMTPLFHYPILSMKYSSNIACNVHWKSNAILKKLGWNHIKKLTITCNNNWWDSYYGYWNSTTKE